jgi:hypothetical protein
MEQALGRAEEGLLMRLPHEVLVDLIMRLGPRDLGHLAATCRLLHYGQSSPLTPNPVEDALRFQARQRGWSRALPVDARAAVKHLLRLARQDDLEFRSISAGRELPISFLVDSAGSLRACGVELQRNEDTTIFLDESRTAYAGSLGFGRGWDLASHSDYLRTQEPTPVPVAEGVGMRSVAIGAAHVLALTDEGKVYTWGAHAHCLGPESPTLLEEISELKMRRVASGSWHSAALTDEGKLYTWWGTEYALKHQAQGAAGAGYPLPSLDELKGALCRPRCVEALAGMRIVSVTAGYQFTVVATDQGEPTPAPATFVSPQAVETRGTHARDPTHPPHADRPPLPRP